MWGHLCKCAQAAHAATAVEQRLEEGVKAVAHAPRRAASAATAVEQRLEKGVKAVAHAPRRAASAAWAALHCAAGDTACKAAAEEGVAPYYAVIAREASGSRFWQACEGKDCPVAYIDNKLLDNEDHVRLTRTAVIRIHVCMSGMEAKSQTLAYVTFD